MDIRKFLVAAAMAAAAAPATAAPVPATTNATGEALILVPLTLTKIDDLSFGTVIPSAVSGMVAINAATGNRTIAGGVTGVPSDVGRRGYFGGAGSPGRPVFVSVASPAQLVSTTNSADTIDVVTLSVEGASPVKFIHPVNRTFSSELAALSSSARTSPKAFTKRRSTLPRTICNARRIEPRPDGCYLDRMQPLDPPEIIRVSTLQVACDGSGEIAPELGHPRVFLRIDPEIGFVECGYCDRRFVLEGGPADRQAA